MKRREFICVLGRLASGFWSRRRTIIAALAAMVLLPIEVSDATEPRSSWRALLSRAPGGDDASTWVQEVPSHCQVSAR